MNTDEIDRCLLRVVKLLTYRAGSQMTNATGFFFLRDGLLYLVTNRHVVSDPANSHAPDELRAVIHNNLEDLTSFEEMSMPLYGSDGKPLWRTHPELGDAVDVVAVEIHDTGVLSRWQIDCFEPANLGDESRPLPPGQPVLILGYPLGFDDTTHHLPMVRRAAVASVYGLPFKGNPYFITDARLHRGSSGSPVVTRLTDSAKPGLWRLLGIHSASLDVSNRDPHEDEPLGLNIAWYASVIEQITRKDDAPSAGESD